MYICAVQKGFARNRFETCLSEAALGVAIGLARAIAPKIRAVSCAYCIIYVPMVMCAFQRHENKKIRRSVGWVGGGE